MKANVIAFLLACPACCLQIPQATALDIRPTLKVAAEFGGDTLVTVLFSDGSTESIKAHNGLVFGGGFSVLNADRSKDSGSGAYLGGRFTLLDYEEKTTGAKAESNGFGVALGYRF